MQCAKAVDAIYPILRYAENVTFDVLPQRVVEITKRFILDTLAVMVAGTRAPGCQEVLDQLREWGGKPEATVAGEGLKFPAHYAALVNGMMAHAFDFDDVHEVANVHPGVVVLTAVLAVSELVEKVSGPELITAIAVGVDVTCRMGLALKRYRGWHPTATCGIFGATLSTGLILGLKNTLLHNATGIAYTLACGNYQCIQDGALTKRLQPGIAAHGSIMAVMLAKRGITGPKNVLEGKWGFYPLYEAGEYDRAKLLDGLGERFEGENLSMKPYPSCRCSHSAIDGTLELCKEAKILPEEVDSIRIEMPPEAYDYVGGPFEPGNSPQVSAQFNAAYNVATAVKHRRFGLEHLESQAIQDPEVLALVDRVTIVTNDDPYEFGPVTVTIKLRSGRTYVRRITTMKGHPANPMTDSECMEKLRQCVAYAGWTEKRAKELAEWVSNLNRTDTPVAELENLLS